MILKMIIKKQLWFSNFITIVITIILLIIVSILIGRNYQNISKFGFPPNKFERETEKRKPPDLLKRELFMASRLISNIIKENPSMLQDIKYIEQMDSFMNENNTSIIIRKNNEILHYSPSLTDFAIKSEDINDEINSFPEKKIIDYSENIYVEKLSFRFPDESKGDVLIVSDTTSTLEEITQFRYSVFIILILFLIAIIIISITITYVLSRNIVKPLNQLKNAALQIRSGNFSFKINTNRKDEIGDLSRTFEEARKQLAETEKIKKKFDDNRNELISNISHDLKTPITTIKGYVEGIIDGVPGSKEKKDKYLKTIYQNAEHMESLINELFLLSEFELKEIPLKFVLINIKDYLTDCVEELKFYLAEKGITLKFDADCNEQEKVYADRKKIKRVILNIINNAVNYKASIDPVIAIKLTEKKEEAQIEIRDNGQGIPEKLLNNIFERFYKVDKARSTNSSGTGLGLYIAKQIVMSHEGRIWAKSQEGKGTSIFFTLKKTHGFSKIIKTEKQQ
ncbi:MAG: HAMP domain-containing sensor histidine kinase [Candidatus Caldatribacteriota bacterium]|nr:HAMP domain-containing sensor histidine kinase [Candidatus Caldatribacteriota bacterium]